MSQKVFVLIEPRFGHALQSIITLPPSPNILFLSEEMHKY